MINDEFNFILNEEMSKRDPLGPNYIYSASKHEIADDLYEVHFYINGVIRSVNYSDREVETNIKEGHWLLVDQTQEETK